MTQTQVQSEATSSASTTDHSQEQVCKEQVDRGADMGDIHEISMDIEEQHVGEEVGSITQKQLNVIFCLVLEEPNR
jgi:hypothetical protein